MASLATAARVSMNAMSGACAAVSLEVKHREVCGLRLGLNQPVVSCVTKGSRVLRMRGNCLRIVCEDQTKMLDAEATSGAEKCDTRLDVGNGGALPVARGEATDADTPDTPGDNGGVGESRRSMSIAEQLEEQYNSLRPDIQKLMEVKPGSIPTPLERRLRRRKQYWDAVSERDDRPFFAAVGLFILVPPIAILGFAAAAGYVDFSP